MSLKARADTRRAGRLMLGREFEVNMDWRRKTSFSKTLCFLRIPHYGQQGEFHKPGDSE
jgi:hypothetical protein